MDTEFGFIPILSLTISCMISDNSVNIVRLQIPVSKMRTGEEALRGPFINLTFHDTERLYMNLAECLCRKPPLP